MFEKTKQEEIELSLFKVDVLREFIEQSEIEDTEKQRLRGYLLDLESMVLKTFQ